ncbi:SRPBCC family protein [Kutzneria kofuensis]|uniref:Polyketide cyclase/dehydrase/lipid transport protein n=1 Tax=Kutzneria kofuensis TaxID=103725 RepID=A0A7W9NE14_9PSEU|nr:SRPBCC family protein [Kutzneria kofuensis]MBB5888924.1 hypothetical protein [Kutzneria kofuensis]
MDLPFIDEHEVLVAAPPAQVWRALVDHAGSLDSPQPLALVLGTEPRRASGTPFEPGSTVAGFAVAEAEPGRLLRLTGRHRFSRYELTFTLAAQPGGTVLAARSNAEFPGLHGFVYRSLVIGSGGHRVVVRRLLASIKRASRP